MTTTDDYLRDPATSPLHEPVEERSSSVDSCSEPATANSELLSPVPSTLATRQLATDPTYELARWELEARIVANQSVSDISQRMGLPKSLVEQYEAKYFNVRHKLPYSSLVLHEVIAPPSDDVWPPGEVGRYWRWLGFAYGVPGLDLAIPPFRLLDEKLQALGLWAYLDPNCSVCDELRIEVAAKLVPIAATISVSGIRLVGRLQALLHRQVRPVPLPSFIDLVARSSEECPTLDSRLDAIPLWKKAA